MTEATPPPSLDDLLATHADVERVELFVTDVNGLSRGKWLTRDKAHDLATKGLPLPRSVFALDIWGRDVPAAGLAFGTGDPDGLCRLVAGGAALVPWATRPTAQAMMMMAGEHGVPFFADPRAMLAGVVARLHARGLHPVVAAELEFYLLDGVGTDPSRAPAGVAPCQVLSTDALWSVEPLLDAIADACRVQSVPIDTMLRENGPGQYEVNLHHVADACQAADHAILLKRIVRAVARRHGRTATFMAKPFGDQAGSGMHVHVSLLDGEGRPAFVGSDGAPRALLHHAVAGLVATMPEVMLLLAPHANSYRRFRRDSHAPMTAGWAVDDRSAAVRVIAGAPMATRIEQRVAGADSNPYLAIAAVLGGMLAGIEQGLDPEPPQTPDAGGLGGRPLPREWGAAIDAFAGSAFAADLLGAPARDFIAACKRQDYDTLLGQVPDTERAAYLTTL